MDPLSFGKLIQHLRRQQGWTVKIFIEKLNAVGAKNVSPSYISKIEVYGEVPSPKLICQIAEVFKYPENELCEKAKAQKIENFQTALNRKFDDDLILYRRAKKHDGSGT